MPGDSRDRRAFTQEQFLENYNGIIVSFENFFIMNHIEIIHIIDYKTERMKFRIGDAECQLECFKISYLAPKNLLCIRDKNFSNFRRSAREDDNFDDIRVFCEKFGLDYDAFKISVNTKKTIFPHREETESNYEPSGYMHQTYYNLKQQEEFTDYEDFVFSNKDTIAVILLAKYKKNDEIEMQDFLDLSGNISNIGKSHTSGFDTNENVKVTHNITVIGLRLLYTLNIEYLFYHHFFEIFNLEEYKTSDYVRVTNRNNYDPFSQYKSYKKLKKAQAKKGNRFIADLLNEIDIENKENSFENVPNVQKELFMVLDVVDPQFNFQNELSNSQLLIFGEGMMKVHFFNYLFKDPTNPRKKHSIKKQIRYFLKKMRAYVAPTDIDIINPTFWLNMNEAQMQGGGSDTGENIGMENLLRKIMEIEKFTLNFDYTNKDFSSFTRPLLTIEIKIQNSLCTFSPTNWWHLVFVLKSILFATGEKSIEKIQKDEECESELKEIKIDRLREMIQEALQKMTKSNEMANRPIVEKKILIEINKGCLELFDDNKKFSNVDLDGLNASFLVYNSKETKFDVDFKKLLIQNEMDEKTDEYRWVLFPGLVENRRENMVHMLKIRIRDKLVVVKKAQWKVFDQFEIFLDTMTVKLTRNFYRKIQKFLLYKEEKKKRAENYSMLDEKKINLLMPSRDMNNLESIEEMKSFQNFDEKLEFSADSSGTPGIVSHNPDTQRNVYSNSLDEISENSSDSGEEGIIESTTQAFRDMEKKLAQMTPRETEKKPKKKFLGDLGSAIAKPFKTVRNIKPKEKKEKANSLPVFFRYFSINEICVALTYKHSESSWLNTKNLRITIKPFIKNAKFVTFARMLSKYEKFCKKNLIKQLPSILKQKILKISMAIEDDDDDINELNQNSAEYKTKRAKNIIFGKYAELC